MKNDTSIIPISGTAPQIGLLLKEGRQAKDLTQKELADILNVTPVTVRNWESGRNTPDIDTLYRICHVLGINVVDLLATEKERGNNRREALLLHNYRLLSENGQRTAASIVGAMLDQEIQSRNAMLRDTISLFRERPAAAAAGVGVETSEQVAKPVFLRLNARNRNADGIVRVYGRSMEPVYNDGDYVYYREDTDVRTGQDVICTYYNGTVIKRVDDDGSLYSVNPDFPFGDPGDDAVFRVEGIVTGIVSEEDWPDKDDRESIENLFADELKEFYEANPQE